MEGEKNLVDNELTEKELEKVVGGVDADVEIKLRKPAPIKSKVCE